VQGRKVVSRDERRSAAKESGVRFIVTSEPRGHPVASQPSVSHPPPVASRLPKSDGQGEGERQGGRAMRMAKGIAKRAQRRKEKSEEKGKRNSDAGSRTRSSG
jgi:hypothetical protein